MKKLLIVLLLSTLLISCGNENQGTNVEINTEKNTVINSQSSGENKEEKSEDINKFVFAGMNEMIYTEIPEKDPENDEVPVELHGQGGGVVISFWKYSMMYGEVAEIDRTLFGVEFEKIKSTKDIMKVIEPYTLDFLSAHIIEDGDIPYEINETIKDSSEIMEINGFEFNVVKGMMDVEMTGPTPIDLYFYGYFTMVEDYPLFFMVTSLEEEVRDNAISTLDDIMSTFREWRDTDRK